MTDFGLLIEQVEAMPDHILTEILEGAVCLKNIDALIEFSQDLPRVLEFLMKADKEREISLSMASMQNLFLIKTHMVHLQHVERFDVPMGKFRRFFPFYDEFKPKLERALKRFKAWYPGKYWDNIELEIISMVPVMTVKLIQVSPDRGPLLFN